MPFFMLFTNIIIASTRNSDLCTFWPLKNDLNMGYKKDKKFVLNLKYLITLISNLLFHYKSIFFLMLAYIIHKHWFSNINLDKLIFPMLWCFLLPWHWILNKNMHFWLKIWKPAITNASYTVCYKFNYIKYSNG